MLSRTAQKLWQDLVRVSGTGVGWPGISNQASVPASDSGCLASKCSTPFFFCISSGRLDFNSLKVETALVDHSGRMFRLTKDSGRENTTCSVLLGLAHLSTANVHYFITAAFFLAHLSCVYRNSLEKSTFWYKHSGPPLNNFLLYKWYCMIMYVFVDVCMYVCGLWGYIC